MASSTGRHAPGLAMLLAMLVAGCASPPPLSAPPPATSVARVTDSPEPAAAPPPAYDAVGEAATYLVDGYGAQETRRARLAKAGPLFWDLEAANQGVASVEANDAEVSEEVIVVERHPEHLRVVYEGYDVRLTFYMELEHFREVVAREALLLESDGEPFANGCGVALRNGALVEMRPPSVGYRRTEYRSSRVLARGFLPEQVIARVYKAPTKLPEKHRFDCELDSPVTLRDAPAGEIVAKLTQNETWGCQLWGPEVRGARRVAVFDEGHLIVGFAPTTAVTQTKEREVDRFEGFGLGGLWGSSHAIYLYLWPGDALLTRDGGAQVGSVVKRALKVSLHDQGSDKDPLVELPINPWSWTELGITKDTRDAAEKKYAAWLGRIRYDKLTVTGGAHIATVRKELEWDRSGIAGCFDEALEKQPGTSFRYDVDLEFAQDKPEPKLTTSGPTDDELQSCLAIWLRNDEVSLRGTRARFTLELTPHALVDAVGP